MRAYKRQAAFTAALAVVLATACYVVDWNKTQEYRRSFQEAAPQPEWWDRVSTDDVMIRSYDDLLSYWQDRERSDIQFFKAAYQAILYHPLDDDLVVNAVNLLPHGDSAYPYTTTMLEFVLERHFYYERPLSNYLGKSGDTIAGIARRLAVTYNNIGDYASTVELVERLLDQREFEVNDQWHVNARQGKGLPQEPLGLFGKGYGVAEYPHGLGRVMEAHGVFRPNVVQPVEGLLVVVPGLVV